MDIKQAAGDAWRTWLQVLTNPSLQTFHDEVENTNLGTAMLWMAVSGFLMTLLTMLIVLPVQLLFMAPMLFSDFGDAGLGFGFMAGFFIVIAVFGVVMGAISAPITLLLSAAVYYLLAMLFGGRGSFETQTYLMSTYSAPLYLARLVTIIPFLGLIAYLGIIGYKLVLHKRAIEVTHGLESAQAIWVVLIPFLTMMLMTVCLVSFYFVMLAGIFLPFLLDSV